MIEAITFKKVNGLGSETKTLEFGKKNVIIGPKGGGKSTLYDLLANLPKGVIISTVKDALEKHGLKLDSYVMDGERYLASVLKEQKVNRKNKDDFYEGRTDVIYQDDPIKKSLTDDKDVFNAKMAFARKLANESVDVNNFVVKVKNLYDNIHKVNAHANDHINWLNALDIKGDDKSKEQIIFELNYSDSIIKTEIRPAIEFIKEKIRVTEGLIWGYENELLQINSNESSIYSETFIKQLAESITKIIGELKTINKIYQTELARIVKIGKVTSAFNYAYREVVAKLKRNKMSENIVASYMTQSKDYFKQMAYRLKTTRQAFESVVKDNIEISLNGKEETSSMLEIAINDSLTLDQSFKYDVLKKVLHNAKTTPSLVENWIKSSEGQSKEFKNESLVTEVAKKIEEKILVLANGQNYEDLSLGQRSIYGIKYKFGKSEGKPIFLDQPEDNLDNNTIAAELVDAINKRNEQIFIVTHNANIGLLTKPERIIVSQFTTDETYQDLNQYQIGKIKEENSESDAAHYLEGGLRYIEERLEIIKGEK